MVAASKRTRTIISSIYALAAFFAAWMMLRSFHTWDHLALFRRHSTTSLQAGNGFLIGGYVSTAAPHHQLGFFRTATPIGPISLAMFEDQTLFMSHLNCSPDGFDGELFGFRIALSRTDERNSAMVRLPQWAPVAAFSLLACGDLVRRTSRLLRPRAFPALTS